MNNQIVEVLDALCEKFGLAIDWTEQNVTPYIQELMEKIITYELWTSVMWIVICAIMTFLCFFIAWRISKTEGFDWDDINIEVFPSIACTLIFCGSVLSIVLGVVLIVQSLDIITCLTFPEKIIFNIIQSMM